MKTIGINQPFKQKFSEFIKQKNFYRSKNPRLFKTKSIRSKSAFGGLNDTSTVASDYGGMTSSDVRTIKQKNYGKWYLKPKHFNKKLAPITEVK